MKLILKTTFFRKINFRAQSKCKPISAIAAKEMSQIHMNYLCLNLTQLFRHLPTEEKLANFQHWKIATYPTNKWRSN